MDPEFMGELMIFLAGIAYGCMIAILFILVSPKDDEE